ncbi:MAG TPA: tetratricopeptide repeat protein [Labilithrix sp.]|jgi:Flp pilus assembly protein TadD/uncharacterized protein (AIM24 family)
MSGGYRDPDIEPTSRRLTPSIEAPTPESDVPSDAANEDFLFHLYRGSELLQDNRVHEAKEELEQALHLQPRDAKGQDLLAVVYFRLGLYPRAIAIYEQLRRKNPRDTAILLNLALCYLKTGQPALARKDLEQLLEINPSHLRGWGYLGLACERLGDLEHAQKAFEHGGHAQMARRMAVRLSVAPSAAAAPSTDDDPAPGREVREAVATAFEELDAGELSFSLAEPASETSIARGDSWRPHEIGKAISSTPGRSLPLSKVPSSTNQKAHPVVSKKPDTRDGPPPAPIPQLAPPQSMDRRPTLIAPAPPAANEPHLGSPRAPSFEEHGSVRRPVVAVPPVRREAPTQTSLQAEAAAAVEALMAASRPGVARRETLPPPLSREPTPPPPPVAQLAKESQAAFPSAAGVVLHPSGVALVHTNVTGFSARLESMRVQSNGLTLRTLERQAKGKPTGESFGGVASPLVHASGDGQLVLGPRHGRKLSCFTLQDELCFAREEVLLGFDGALVYENGRLATGEGEFVAVVQLRGKGAVLLEAIGDVLSLHVASNARGLSVRREVILGWFGRLVPRALAASEAPCGQRGLVSFAGEGRVLVASA